jgi:hypothetical protein
MPTNAEHNCIRFRIADGTIPKWEFEKGSRKLALAVNGSLIVDNLDLMLRALLKVLELATCSNAS